MTQKLRTCLSRTRHVVPPLSLLFVFIVLAALGWRVPEVFAARNISVSPEYLDVGGVVTVRVLDDSDSGDDARGVSFSGSAVNAVWVAVKDSAAAWETAYLAVETGAGTGAYEVRIAVTDDPDPVTTEGSEGMPGAHGQTIEFRYGIFTRRVHIDSIGPTIELVSPLDDAAVPPGLFTLEATVTDADSAFTDDADDLNQPGGGAITLTLMSVSSSGGSEVSADDIAWEKVPGGWRMRAGVNLGSRGRYDSLKWQVTAVDRAGNRESSSRTLSIDGKKPAYSVAVTGHWWDPTEAPRRRLRDGCDARRTSLRVHFLEDSGLDPRTIEPSDFTVDNITPTAVLTVDTAAENESAFDAKKPRDVFLTLPAALAAHSKPDVRIVGEISDQAGNATDYGAGGEARDGLPPRLTVRHDLALSRDETTITVESDEALSQTPVIELATQTSGAGALDPAIEQASVEAIATGTYRAVVEAGDEPGAREARKINMVVRYGATVVRHEPRPDRSLADKIAQEVECIMGDSFNAESPEAFTFGLDPLLNNGYDPEFVIGSSRIIDGSIQNSDGAAGARAEVDTAAVLRVTVDFGRQCGMGADPAAGNVAKCFSGPANRGEAEEYFGDTHDAVRLTNVTAVVTQAGGREKTLPVTVAGSDGVRFSLLVPGADLGRYTIGVQAQDEAGNVSRSWNIGAPDTFQARFIVVKAEAFHIPLAPGWNLISLPFSPRDPRLSAVIPRGHPVSVVLSYEQATEQWSVSRRDPESGQFAGDVTVVNAEAGYFVHTDSFQALTIHRPAPGGAANVPQFPARRLEKGWNLIPVLSSQRPLPVEIDAARYLSATAWVKAVSYEPHLHEWVTMERPAAGDSADPPKLKIGRAYWVWTREAGTIVP